MMVTNDGMILSMVLRAWMQIGLVNISEIFGRSYVKRKNFELDTSFYG